jgi:hypothetical protein
MSLRSKPLMRLRPTKLCLALMLAARRFGPRRQCCYLIMSLRSKPLLRLRPTRLCLALMLAARRFGSSTPPRENRACRAPGPRRLDVPCHRFAPNCFCIPTEQWACCLSALRVGAQVGPPPYPAPWQSACATHSFDAFGQTLNYFTSRAAAIWRYRERSGQRRRWEPS